MRKINLQLFAEDLGGETGGPEGGDVQDVGMGQGEASAPSRGTVPQAVSGGVDPIRQQLDYIAQLQKQYEDQLRRYEELLQSYGGPASPYDEAGYGYETEAQPGVDPFLQQLMEEIEDLKLDREIARLSEKYDDFAENVDAILQTAVDLGIDNLEVAYRYWKVDHLPPPPDIEVIKKQAIDEYLASKRDQASKPAPQGAGGGVPTSGQKPKTLDEATKSALRRLERAQ